VIGARVTRFKKMKIQEKELLKMDMKEHTIEKWFLEFFEFAQNRGREL
jgi:hypothetical protein